MVDDIEDAVTARLERAEGVIEGEGGGGDGEACWSGHGGLMWAGPNAVATIAGYRCC